MDPNLRPQVSRPPSASIPPQGPPPPPPLSNLHQYQMHSPYAMAQPHTLPPLQHHQNPSPIQHTYLQPFRNDMPRYPTTSGTDVYAVSSAPLTTHAPVNSLPPSTFLGHQHPQQFQPHHMLPPTTATQAYPQPIAPAPPRDRRSEYGAVPLAPFTNGENKQPVWAGAEGLPPTSGPYMPKDPPRTQVVGTQGRRGILPSVPGRAAVTNGVNGTKGTTIPAKDADGKFPCPHCNKTYLHAKHLKRHLLRHTGDRPYMCVLCKDTFSRSDILKRHFQKCSLRRGNPTGVSHLSHPHAHLKRAQAAGVVPKLVQGDLNHVGLPPIDSTKPPTTAAATTLPDNSKRHVVPAAHNANGNNNHGNNTGDIDWSTMLQPGAHENYMNPVFPSTMAPVSDAMRAQMDNDRKFYPTATSGHQENSGLNGLYLASTTLSGDGTVQAARQ
ncbi:C2H2 type zinc finger containing protein [Coccidioides posadasii C735 delta SOWgp]|uniref:C2H2 type zinc finger containing protein n=1 Tax=Coccidioides posadasii (strain C735) TaxID=222929 RepID=C5PJ25_COCP7|nr:C2H2 type zinc finger containing protein [Coccidioides posadasii C735 delta SOWgp]EER22974.1 C2H2 type zinc finger containing protein [Coccidioides posadasii C735 delta SOWgp]|eukprot:XP_003065119.1 C2H2 type zinc finger containing protein [Coccidioides posadasii C735 delta SOWgp]